MIARIPENCSPYILPGLGLHIKTMMEVAEIVCKFLNTDLETVKMHCRKREIVKNRQIVMHSLYWYGWGCSAVARFFKPYDHATVIHSYQVVKNDMFWDKELRKQMKDIYKLLKNGK
jgi:chromosomal replication initiation ATPase DnaA